MRVSERVTRAQAPLDQERKSSRIPSPHDPGAVAVSDGQLLAGWIVERDKSHFAFDAAGILVGEYDTRTKAVRALPLVECDVVGRDEDSRRGRSRCRR